MKAGKATAWISFCVLAVIIMLMMAATVVEKAHGTPVAMRLVYHNPVFIALWAVMAACGLCYLLSHLTGRRFQTLLLHLSLAVILAGAFVTHIWGRQGTVRLPRGEAADSWTCSDGKQLPLPVEMTLEEFEVLTYPGSRAASDYRSTVSSPEGTYVISMNRIARIKGYRFYQSGFDGDASVLTVNHDPWGIGITYTGYALLLLSMIGFFFQKGSLFRSAAKRVAGASSLAVVLLALGCTDASAQSPKALPREVADAFGDLYVYYNDRVCPFETMAREYTLKAYGKPGWGGFDAPQVVTGWLFYYDWWTDVPFKVKAKDRGTPREEEKEYLFRSVASGDAWKLYPVAGEGGDVVWYSCNDALPREVVEDYDRWVFIRKVMDMVASSVRSQDWEEVVSVVGKIRDYQVKVAGRDIPSPQKVRAEKLYNRISRPRIPFMASVTFGILLFVLAGVRMSRGRRFPRGIAAAAAATAALLVLYLSCAIGLRWYVSGHAPLSGSYSVMMLMAWFSAVAMVLLWRKFPLVLPMGFLLAGFTMLIASMSGANPQITHLMPVLQSPLLSVHVLTMMLSYTLLGLVALNGVMGLLVPPGASERLRDVSLVILYPAVFLLMGGTFLGAVWANISWGNYWSWDPKETWALVTFLVYSFALHGNLLKPFRSPRFFHCFSIIAFLCVLVTYFGVNLILGGMHAYA